MKNGFTIVVVIHAILYSSLAVAQDRPNVIVIMTDDQGIGDFGCMGNPLIQTPNIDAMFNRSIQFSNFYVSPVCAPTRACLMTGRYHYRTRVVDTYLGRAMMDPAEVTLAEVFKTAGYSTGIFGKWHLGDCYPMRAMDQGFDQAIVHRGGGIGQPSDPVGAEAAYTNPILFHNGKPHRETGYCTDVYYDYAIEFINECKSKDRPFFVYLPDNCPHGPFQDVPGDWWEEYKDADLSHDKYPTVAGGNPVAANTNKDKNARIFAMISNIDENIGRLQNGLKRLDLFENTIIVFLTDNGPNGARYVQGLRGQKTSVYEGGIKTLCLMQWPVRFKNRKTVAGLAAHIDLFPTLLDACNIASTKPGPKLDGVSLMPLVDGHAHDWESTRKPLFVQVHRGNRPQRYHHFAVRDHRWKLVHHSGFHRESFDGEPQFQLFDIASDPFEKSDVANENPERVIKMVATYDEWFDDVSSTRSDNYDCPRIELDPTKENPVVLTRQDVRRDASESGWGHALRWELKSEEPRVVSVTCRFNKVKVTDPITLAIGRQTYTTKLNPESNSIQFDDIPIAQGSFDLRVTTQSAKGKTVAAHQVDIDIQEGHKQ